jgi:hypothetical protein
MGVAAGIDYGRMRKDGLDQPDVTEVVRQLIGEVLAAAAQRGRFLEITAAERAQV